MEDQMLDVVSMQETTPDMLLSKPLLKKEQRLIARLQEVQEAETRAHDRFQRAKKRVKRRRERLDRVQGKLALVRKQIADLQITDERFISTQPALVITATPESINGVEYEEISLVQSEQETEGEAISDSPTNTAVELEPDGFSFADEEFTIPGTSILEQEITSMSADAREVTVSDKEEDQQIEQEYSASLQETSSPISHVSEPLETILEPEVTSSSYVESDISHSTDLEEVPQEEEASPSSTIETATSTTNEQELVASTDSAAIEPKVDDTSKDDISTHSNLERKPTNPLRLDQDDQPGARVLSPDIQAIKETWVAAESAMQHARNAAQGIAASISFLSQTDGLSNEFMEELVRKQAEANKALQKAQDAARTAYELFVQAQKDAECSASQPVDESMNLTEVSQQQHQDHSDLPTAEENGVDQTAKLHAIRLYKEW